MTNYSSHPSEGLVLSIYRRQSNKPVSA